MTGARWAGAGLIALCGSLAGACSEYPSVTDVPGEDGGTSAVDTLAPVIDVGEMPERVEEGSVLSFNVTDDVGLDRVRSYVLLEDSVVWTSPDVDLDGERVYEAQVALAELGEDFPFGEALLFLPWARDESGRERYAGAPDDAAGDVEQAEPIEIVVFRGSTFALPEGSQIGDLAYDQENARAYFTNTPFNYVGAFSVDGRETASIRIPVGSQPDLLALQPWGWGGGATLVVSNSGASDLSIVDLDPSGDGVERRRVTIPFVTVTVGEESFPLRRQANAMVVHCPTAGCSEPRLYLGSPQLGQPESRSAVRSFAVDAPNPLSNMAVLAPVYDAALEADEPVEVRVEHDGMTLFRKDGVSRCGTLAFGSTTLATTRELGGPVFVADRGEAESACGESGRILRFNYENGEYRISAAAVAAVLTEDRIDGVERIALNDNATRVLLLGDGQVWLTDGVFNLLATLPVEGASALAFIEGQEGAGGIEEDAYFAIAAGDGVRVYELRHYNEVARFETGTTPGDRLLFVRTDWQGGLALLGVTADREGLYLVGTSIDELRRGALGE